MEKKYTCLIVIFLIVASCASFGRIAKNDFIDYDDDKYITENYQIQSGFNLQNIKWVSTAIVLANWHPLTLLSHMLDWKLFGANAYGHHLVSLLFHIGAVIFLFLFFNKTTNNLWPATFAATFFALHPLRVESVAWAAERKDVLSIFFGMASIYVYAFYSELPKLSKYFLCLILFALALMSKPMMVTLPFVLMLLDYWPLERWQKALSAPFKSRFKLAGRLVWEKIPFICLTIAVSIITFWVQNNEGATSFGEKIPFVTRGANAIVSYIAYWEKTLWPVNLALFYTYDLPLSLWKVLISLTILITITFVTLYYIKKMPFLFTGWFWYMGSLIPVIGLVQVGTQAMADRYTYLPSIGIAIMLAWGIHCLFEREYINKKILFPVGIAIITFLAILTWQQCGYWKNSIKIWNHALRVTNNNYLAYSRLGNAYGEIKQYQKAIYNFNQVIRIRPDYEIAYNGRGFTYNAMGMPQRAIDEFNKAINLNQIYAAAYNNRAFSYFMLGDEISGCRDARVSCALGNCKILEAAHAKGLCR